MQIIHYPSWPWDGHLSISHGVLTYKIQILLTYLCLDLSAALLASCRFLPPGYLDVHLHLCT